jgi:hypothetical protein
MHCFICQGTEMKLSLFNKIMSWRKVLLENLPVASFVKMSPYLMRIEIYYRVHSCSPLGHISPVNSIPSHPTFLRCIICCQSVYAHFLSVVSSGFPTTTQYAYLFSSTRAIYPHPPHPKFDYPNNI